MSRDASETVRLSSCYPYAPLSRPCEPNFHRAAQQNNWNSLVIEGPPESGLKEAQGFREEARTPSKPVGAWAGARATGLAEEGKGWVAQAVRENFQVR